MTSQARPSLHRPVSAEEDAQCSACDRVQALGIAVDIGPEGVSRCLEEVGLGFMFAPR